MKQTQSKAVINPAVSSGQQQWVLGADNLISPCFEGPESISGPGLPQAFKEFLPEKDRSENRFRAN